MSRIPIVEHIRCRLSEEERNRADQVAASLLQERPELQIDEELQPLVCRELGDHPTLHLDDMGGIPLLEAGRDLSFQEDRARLRAGSGDFVASCAPPVDGYEDYCRERLKLGSVAWLTPKAPRDSAQVAANCWQDDAVRHTLLHAVREGRLRYLHPHRGSKPVWELASLLSHDAGRAVQVIAPPPALTEWVNNKLAIADLSRRLFGDESVPRTMHAANLAKAAEIIRELASECSAMTLKLPDSVGGGGNVIIKAADYTGRSLTEIHDQLRREFGPYSWEGESELLVGSWETDVCSAPSAQFWIPPEAEGPPILEGLFVQDFADDRGVFIGARPARFSQERNQEIVDRCSLLAHIFQRWGYVGRCSFDMLLVGEDESVARLEFLECNGRWGAASLPMTLMNRLFGDWLRQPYAVRDIPVDGLDQLTFVELVTALDDDLYDARSGQGTLIILNPARIAARSTITLLATAESWEQATQTLQETIPQQLEEIVKRGTRAS